MGQPSRAAGLRNHLSHDVTLPFPHLGETEMPTTGESRDGET